MDMKRKMCGLWASAFGGALALAPLMPSMGQGIVPCAHEARFGLLEVARLQTARLAVINLVPPDPVQPPDPVHPPDPTTPPDPCRVAIGFLHPDGQPFVDAAGLPIILEQELGPGESAVLELRSADAFRGSRSARMPIRATGILRHAPPPDDGAPDPCGAVVPSLEVYEPVTGRTQIFTHPQDIFDFNPQPEPPLPQ